MISINGAEVEITPDFLTDTLFQFEVESKGVLFGTIVSLKKISYEFTFYDSYRLKQDVDEELCVSNWYHEPNIIVLSKVTLSNVLSSLEQIISDKKLTHMVPI